MVHPFLFMILLRFFSLIWYYICENRKKVLLLQGKTSNKETEN